MKRVKRILSLLIVMTIIISATAFAVQANNDDEHLIKPNQARKEALVELKTKEDKFKVKVVGNINTDKIDDKINKKSYDSYDQFKIEKGFETVWFDRASSAALINDVNMLKKILSKGTSVYFIGLEDMNILNEILRDGKLVEESVENSKPDYQYVTQNKSGDYFIGKGYFQDILNEEEMEVLLVSAWNRRNDENYTTPMKMEKQEKILAEKLASIVSPVAYASSSDFAIDSKWRSIGGWNSYEFTSTYGDVNEWKSSYHYNDGYDDYYAMVGSTYMTPTSGFNYHSNYLEVNVDCDMYQSDNEMFKYSPKSEPSSNTYSFSVGAGTNGEATIGASWDIVENDLNVSFSGTSMTSEVYQVKFDYNGTTTYSRNESNQDWCVIVQRDSGTSCEIYNNRRGYFYGTIILNKSNCGQAYKTIINE